MLVGGGGKKKGGSRVGIFVFGGVDGNKLGWDLVVGILLGRGGCALRFVRGCRCVVGCRGRVC